jgi:hypothetical protein
MLWNFRFRGTALVVLPAVGSIRSRMIQGCHSMASSIGFSDPTCMLVDAAEFYRQLRK